MTDRIETVFNEWLDDHGMDDMGLDFRSFLDRFTGARIAIVELPEPHSGSYPIDDSDDFSVFSTSLLDARDNIVRGSQIAWGDAEFNLSMPHTESLAVALLAVAMEGDG